MRFTNLAQQMGHGMPLKCSDPDKIVSRFVKSCHDLASRTYPFTALKIVPWFQNHVTIPTFSKTNFWVTSQQFSTLTRKWWWCHFNHQPPFFLTLPWTIPQHKTNQVQSPAWTLIHTPTSTCIQPPSVVPQASKSYSLHPTTLCSSTSFHLYLFKPRNAFRPLEDHCIQLH